MIMMLASCAGEEDVSVPDNGTSREIRFSASTELTRVGDVTTNNLKSFNVYAYTTEDGKPNVFMNNVTVTKSANNLWTYSPVQYWPSDKSLDFYAFSPADWVGDNNPLNPIEYNAFPAASDIVYAVLPDMEGTAGMPNPEVVFNFRHALSKITVKLSSSNPNLAVVVSHVALTNIKTKGNFNFPTGSTSDPASEDNVGKWTDQNTAGNYPLHWAQTPGERFTLTSTPTALVPQGVGMGGILYMLPQELTFRSNGTGNDNYLAVLCVINDAKSGTKLWPNENTPEHNIVLGGTFGEGILKFPLTSSKFSSWQPGCHYIYNVVINSNEEMGGIAFGTPSVDTFIEVNTSYE